MPETNPDNYKPLAGWLIVEPLVTWTPPSGIILIKGERSEGLETHIEARVLRLGEKVIDVAVGEKVLINPHAGTLLPVPEGHAERLTIPVTAVIGILED